LPDGISRQKSRADPETITTISTQLAAPSHVAPPSSLRRALRRPTAALGPAQHEPHPACTPWTPASFWLCWQRQPPTPAGTRSWSSSLSLWWRPHWWPAASGVVSAPLAVLTGLPNAAAWPRKSVAIPIV